MQLPNLRNAKEIAAGGEGKIFEHPSNPNKVIKLYHTPRPLKYEQHLKDLSSLSDKFVKPLEVYTNTQSVLGFSMEYIDLNEYWLFNNLFNKGFCNTNKIDVSFKHKVLEQLRVELESIHSKGIVVGDLNQYNLFVSKSGDILFVDVDSFQTTSILHSGVLLDDIRDWTTSAINSKTDSWAYDILAFWSTTFCHPFKWVVPGNKDTLEQRVVNNKSILSKIKDVKIPPLYVAPTGDVEKQFQEVFKGMRYMIRFDKAHIPIPVVIPKQVHIQTNMSVKHLYDNVTELYNAGTQCTIKVNDEWILMETSIAKTITKFTTLSKCDKAYPAKTLGLYALFSDKTITGIDKIDKSFLKPQVYFNDGSLMVVDYGTDTQWCYSLSHQLSGIRCTQTPVFAKSILFRDIPVQNFGASKMVSIPILDSYNLIPVKDTTKNAMYFNGVLAVELKDKRKTEYHLIKDSRVITCLDYLPHFTVKDKFIFLPRLGMIEVMDSSTGATLTQFIMSICTESSKLYNTTSGILLLENNSLYLLNSN